MKKYFFFIFLIINLFLNAMNDSINDEYKLMTIYDLLRLPDEKFENIKRENTNNTENYYANVQNFLLSAHKDSNTGNIDCSIINITTNQCEYSVIDIFYRLKELFDKQMMKNINNEQDLENITIPRTFDIKATLSKEDKWSRYNYPSSASTERIINKPQGKVLAFKAGKALKEQQHNICESEEKSTA